MEIALLGLLILIGLATFFKKNNISGENGNSEELTKRISELEKSLSAKEENIKYLQNSTEVLKAKLDSFEKVKTEKTQIEERLKLVEQERNNLKNKNTSLLKEEEGRNETLRKSVESTNTLQQSLKNEKERLNDERVREAEDRLEKMKLKWGEHERDIENHIKLICKNHVLKYISQEDFPHSRNKPDNSIEIMDQLIVFDAKSPANDDLSNFPKYIKLQTESLKKYAKHEDVKKDLFLVIPSNTLHVIMVEILVFL